MKLPDFEVEKEGFGKVEVNWDLSDPDDPGSVTRTMYGRFDMFKPVINSRGDRREEITFKWKDIDIHHASENKHIWLWSMTAGMEKVLLDDEADLILEIIQNYLEERYDEYNTALEPEDIVDMYED